MNDRRRNYTKTRTDAVLMFCAVIVLVTVIWRSESKIAETVVSSAFILAGAALGIYQGVGHADMRITNKKEGTDNAANNLQPDRQQ